MSSSNTKLVYYHTDHGAELYARGLRFTEEEQEWRKQASSYLQSCTVQGVAHPTLTELHMSDNAEGTLPDRELRSLEVKWYRDRLTGILQTLRIVNEVLAQWFESPNWQNQPHVVGELVYILLSRRSKIEDAARHFAAIRDYYPDWESVADADPLQLKALISGGGLEGHKVAYIQGALRAIRARFGRIRESDLGTVSDAELDEFLQALPGVGPKSSACVLMYARETDVFPADTHCIRTLDRLGVFAPLGLEWTQEDHKKAESALRILIPPHIRGTLHRNLLALGRELCTSRNPLCDQCELRKFCRYYRIERQASAEQTRPSAIDVFAGAGGFSLGLEQAGFKIVAAIDNDPDAVRTYRLNHPQVRDEAVIEGDARLVDIEHLARLLGGRTLDLLAGGPPCQGFSSMGNRVPHRYKNGHKRFGADYQFEDDDRNHLFRTIIGIAQHLRPRYVIIENVPGLATAEIQEMSFAEHIAGSLGSAGYDVQVLRLEAVNFGIPQRRHRYFVVGTRYGEVIPDLDGLVSLSEPVTTIRHALHDLPPLDDADGKWIARHNSPLGRSSELSAPYLEHFGIRGTTRILYNHVTRFNNEDDVELYSHLRQGETYADLVERLTEAWGKHPAFAKYSTTSFHDKYFRLEFDGQSKTIVSHLKKDGNSFVHPEQNRSISVREAARLQSFPDDYIFCGSRGPQFAQIGNAVPPVMARAIGEMILDAMGRSQEGPVALPDLSSYSSGTPEA